MKFKKILAIVAAASMAISAFSSVAMAGSYGSPVLSATVTPVDLSEDFGDAAYANCLAVTVSYSGFDGFSAYKAMTGKGVGITAAQVKLGYDANALEYIATMDADFSDGTAGGTDPVMAYAWANAGMKAATSGDFMTAYFLVKDGVDFDKDAVTFTFEEYQFTVTNSTSKTAFTKEVYGNIVDGSETIEAEAFTYGATTPATEYVNVTTDGNVNGVDDGQIEKGSVVTVSAKEVEGKTAQLYANGAAIDAGDYTVNEDTSFTVVYTDIPVVNQYTYKVADYGKNEAKAGIFYALAIKNSENVMTLGVAGKAFTATDVPVVEGDTELTMTYVILGVPADLLTDVPSETTLTGAVNGAYELAE